MALAPLGFTVDTGPVAKAVADLDRLTSATAKAQAGTKGITAPTTAAANATKQLGAASATAATQMTLATNAVRANNAALVVTSQSAGMARAQMQNLSAQFTDIGVMIASGQSPFMLLAQQLPQVTMHGGRLTGVMGALKSTFAGLFSPLGLLTTGFVLAGSAAVSYFTSASDEADIAAEALAEQEDLIQRVADRWGDTIPALREYANALDEARDAADLQSGSQIVLNSYFDEVRRLIPEVNAELSRFAATASAGGWGSALEDEATAIASAFDEVDSALAGASESIAAGEDATQDLKDIQETLTDLINNDAIPATGDLRDIVNELAAAYGIAAEKAAALALTMPNADGGRLGGETLDEAQARFDFLRRFNERMNPEEFEDQRRGSRSRTRRGGRSRRSDAERAADRYSDMVRESQQFIAAQELEQRALGMTEEAAAALRYEQDLLNRAVDAGIKLTPEIEAELRSYAESMAMAEVETRKLMEAQEYQRDLMGGALDDLRSALDDGKLTWEELADVAIGALDRIIDKLQTEFLDAIFRVNNAGASSGGGGGGLFGFLGGLLGIGGGGGFTGFERAWTAAVPGLWAKGGAFENGISGFSNTVVNRPTPFMFAKGAGIMGEAGPEAIMPLRRGPDGKLGVAANQNGGIVVKLENYGTSKEFEVQQISESEVRIIARDEAAKIAQANNKFRQKRYQAGGQFG